MLTAFSIENYRAFADETTIELRPLTLLFGYNNAGKSALIRALALIADSTRPDAVAPLDLSSEAARDGTFEDLVSKLSGSRTIKVGLCFDEGQLRAAYDVTVPTGTYQQIVTKLRVDSPSPSDRHAGMFEWAGPSLYSCQLDDEPVLHESLRFAGLIPQHRFHSWGLLEHLELELQQFGRQLRWIGSLRRYPPRSVRYRGGAIPRIGMDGSGVAEILAHDKLVGGPLLPEVSGWYEAQFKRKLDLLQRPDGQFSLTLEPLSAGAGQAINLADTGEGMAQVLPVLVAAAMARHPVTDETPILAIEQPELHLHPEVHASLAKHLCDLAASDSPPRMLIETHAENFLLGVQIQIAKGELSPDKVLVYWVKQLDDGTSHARPISFDDEGYLQGFPRDVFREDLELARVLLELRERAAK
jgi:hypothetical protein